MRPTPTKNGTIHAGTVNDRHLLGSLEQKRNLQDTKAATDWNGKWLSWRWPRRVDWSGNVIVEKPLEDWFDKTVNTEAVALIAVFDMCDWSGKLHLVQRTWLSLCFRHRNPTVDYSKCYIGGYARRDPERDQCWKFNRQQFKVHSSDRFQFNQMLLNFEKKHKISDQNENERKNSLVSRSIVNREFQLKCIQWRMCITATSCSISH